MNVSLSELSLPDLRAQFGERAIAPGDARYDEARAVFYGGFDRRPGGHRPRRRRRRCRTVIASRARDGLELAVRSGGHSNAGHSTTDGGIVLDLRDMKALDIDAADQTAWVGSRADRGRVHDGRWRRTDLRPGSATPARSGSAGITLGGGVGYLVRKHGLTIDYLLAAEIVTADGRLAAGRRRARTRTCSGRSAAAAATSASRPGSSSGCTSSPAIVGGMLMLPATPETIAGSSPRRRPRRRSCRRSPT